MISFDLNCAEGHEFEAWFASTSAFQSQLESQEVACPICGDRKVTKALMTPNVATSDVSSSRAFAETTADDVGAAVAKADSKQSPELATALRQLRQAVEANCDYVGDRFAEEARKICYGETEERNIYGETSSEEARSLQEEGIEFGVLPWPNRNDA